MNNKTTQVRILENGNWGGYLALWGSPTDLDLLGHFFTAQTDFHVNPQKSYAHYRVVWRHGLDEIMHDYSFGHVLELTKDDLGLRCEVQPDSDHTGKGKEFYNWLLSQIQLGMIHWSPDSTEHLVEMRTPRILKWPLVRISLTDMPVYSMPMENVNSNENKAVDEAIDLLISAMYRVARGAGAKRSPNMDWAAQVDRETAREEIRRAIKKITCVTFRVESERFEEND